MTLAPPQINPFAGGPRATAQRTCVIHFLCGDSIGQGFQSAAPGSDTTVGPPNAYIFNQHSIEYVGTRSAATTNAASRIVPYTPGHGLVGASGPGSVDPGLTIAGTFGALSYDQSGGGRGYGAGVDHVFCKWAFSGAQMNPTPSNSLIGLAPGESGNDAFVTANSLGGLAAAIRGYPGYVYLGALFMISLAGDASTTNVANSHNIYATSCTTFVNDFRTSIGATSTTLPVFFGRAPTVGAGVTTLDNLGTVRTQTDTLGGSNGITVVDIDARERHSDDVHSTARGSSQIGATLAQAYIDNVQKVYRY